MTINEPPDYMTMLKNVANDNVFEFSVSTFEPMSNWAVMYILCWLAEMYTLCWLAGDVDIKVREYINNGHTF